MTARVKDLPIQERRVPSVLRHAGLVLPILLKSAQHPSAVLSAYLQKKHRLPAEEKRAISGLAFNALRLYPAALMTAAQAAGMTAWDIGVAVPPQHGWFSVKFLSEQAGLAVAASAVLIANESFRAAVAADDLPGDTYEVVAAALSEQSECPDPQQWCAEVRTSWIRCMEEAAIASARPLPDTKAEELLAVRACVRPWIVRSWAKMHPDGYAYALRLADSLMTPSPVGLRVYGAEAQRTFLLEQIKKMGHRARFGNLSPSALILEERARVTGIDEYRAGVFEIQDEGSQIIGFAAAPSPGETVLDACAGAGGKTLHLASLMKNTGRVVAADTEFMRLKQVLPRASRCGFDCIEAIPTRRFERDLDQHAGLYSTVLVDAPCTSIGTARRYPLPKWRLEEKSVGKIVGTQTNILNRYAGTVQRGGALIYATCSLLPQENSEVVASFLESHPEFEPAPLFPVFRRQHVHISGMEEAAHTLQLTPLEHGTDGFYMARMIRSYEER